MLKLHYLNRVEGQKDDPEELRININAEDIVYIQEDDAGNAVVALRQANTAQDPKTKLVKGGFVWWRTSMPFEEVERQYDEEKS